MTVAWFRHRPARVPAWVVDAGWAVAVAIAVTIAIRAATEPGARPRDLLAYALGWTIGALLLARRRWPLAVLVASSATLQIYYLLDYPGISAAVPLAVALYTAGAAGHLRRGLLIAGLFVAGAIAFLVLVSQEPVLWVLVDEATLWLAILLFGDAVHSRRVLAPPAAAAGGRAGTVGGVAAQHAAGLHRRAAQAAAGGHRRRLPQGDGAVRRHRRLHPPCRAQLTGGDGGAAERPVLPVRHADRDQGPGE